MGFNIKRYCKQDLIYWEKLGSETTGQSRYKDPVQLKCRWEDALEQVHMMDGRVIQSNAYVITLQLILTGSILWKGTLKQWKKSSFYPFLPSKTQGGYEVFKSDSTPSRQGKDLLFEAYT